QAPSSLRKRGGPQQAPSSLRKRGGPQQAPSSLRKRGGPQQAPSSLRKRGPKRARLVRRFSDGPSRPQGRRLADESTCCYRASKKRICSASYRRAAAPPREHLPNGIVEEESRVAARNCSRFWPVNRQLSTVNEKRIFSRRRGEEKKIISE